MIDLISLPNGVCCLLDYRSGENVSIILGTRNGVWSEPPEKHGISALTLYGLAEGTHTHDREAIVTAFESWGTDFNINIGGELLALSTQCLPRHAVSVFQYLVDIMRNPVFPAGEIERLKAERIEKLSECEADMSFSAIRNFSHAAIGAAGENLQGHSQTTRSFTIEDVRARHADILWRPEDIIISIAGDMKPDTAATLIDAAFGDILPSQAPPRRQTRIEFAGDDLRDKAEEKKQLDLFIGFPVPLGAYRQACVLFDWLIGGGMSAPLFQEVRVKKGLVYDVSSDFLEFGNKGVFYIRAGTGAGNARKVIEASLAVLGAAAREGFSEEEIAIVRKQRLRNLQNDDSAGKACSENLQRFLIYGKTMSPADIDAAIATVTPDMLRKFAYDMLAGNIYALGNCGPQEDMPTPAEIRAAMAKALEGAAPVMTAAPARTPVFNGAAIMIPACAAQDQPEMTVLPNGLRVVSLRRPGNLTIGAWIGVGSQYDAKRRAGISHMNEHMSFRGTLSHGAAEITHIAEKKLVCDFGAFTGHDWTQYFLTGPDAGQMEAMTGLCDQLIFRAALNERELVGSADGSGERSAVLEEIKMINDDPKERMLTRLLATAYAEQPLGRPVIGNEFALRAMTVRHLVAHRDRFYRPNNVVFCAIGPIDHQRFAQTVLAHCGDLRPGKIPSVRPSAWRPGVQIYQRRDERKMADIVLAMAGYAANSKAQDTLSFLLSLLNLESGAFYQDVVRGRRLTHGFFVDQLSARDNGLAKLSFSADALNCRPVIASFYHHLRRLAATVPLDAFEHIKTGSELELRESVSNRILYECIGQSTLFAGKPFTPWQRLERLQEITVVDIQAVACDLLRSPPVMVVEGPADTPESAYPSLSELYAFRNGALALSGPALSLH